MAAGMVPAAMATGEGGEFRAPMAIAVIGGLLVSTVLSLVFIPSLYTLMDDLSHVTGRVFRWVLRPNRGEEGGETAHAGAPIQGPPLAPVQPQDLGHGPTWKRVTEFGGREARGGDERLPPPQMQPAAE
jgi:hypothetical protein